MNHIDKLSRLLVAFVLILGLTPINTYAQYPIQVNTNVQQPVPPYLPQIKANIMGNRTGQLNQDISSHLAVTLVNSGNSQKRVKLSGTIERLSPGPMSITLRPGYQPSNPVLMNPQQMIRLNQPMLDDAFGGFSQSDLIFNNTSLSQLSQGGFNYKLPEGTYRICVTAYDYDNPGQSAPLSAPGTGCAVFIICYKAAAPQLIMPVSTMMQSNSGFQDFTPHSSQIQFSWTPPTTTCGMPLGALNYDLEIRKVFPGQTISDAVYNPPVFDKKNIPTTTFILDTLRFPNVFKSGERYTLRVKTNFRPMPGSPLEIANDGYSQIAGLNYVLPKTEVLQPAEPITIQENEDPSEFATNRINGRLLWAFKKSEVDFSKESATSYSSTALAGMISNTQITLPSIANIATTPVGVYLGNTAIQSQNYAALAQTDPTLNFSTTFSTLETYFPPMNTVVALLPNEPAENVISTNAASSLSYKFENSGSIMAEKRFPLSNVTVVLKGKKKAASTSQSQTATTPFTTTPGYMPYTIQNDLQYAGLRTVNDWPGLTNITLPNISGNVTTQDNSYSSTNINDTSLKVLASGITDSEGNYTLDFIHPRFSGFDQYEELVLTVSASGFYDYSYNIEMSEIDSLQDINLGEKILLANTYRFAATINAPSLQGSDANLGKTKVLLYREAQEIEANSYLQQEGNVSPEAKVRKTIQGKEYRLVAVDSIRKGEANAQIFDFGKLFYQGSLHVVVESSAENLKNLQTDLRVTPQNITKSDVMLVKAGYDAVFTEPAVKGRVALYAGENTVSIKDALVKVTYNPEDVLFGGPPPLTDSEITTIINTIRPGQINLPGQGVIDPLIYGSIQSPFGISSPVEVSAPATSGTVGMVGNMATTQFTVMPAISITTIATMPANIANLIIPEPVDNGYYSTKTDESGNYYIGNLPTLKPNAEFTIQLVSVPQKYSNLAVNPENKKFKTSISSGVIEYKEFKISAEVTPLVGRVVDADGEPLADAKLHFEGSDAFFETGSTGVFQTSFYPGTHTLIVEKQGYVERQGQVHIEANHVKVDSPLVLESSTVETSNNTQAPTNNAPLNSGNEVGFYQSMYQTSTVQMAIANGNLMTPALFGQATAGINQVAVPASGFNAMLNNTFTNTDSYAASTLDMGEIGYLDVKRARVKFIVKDESDGDKVLDGVTIGLFDTSGVTDVSGEWLYEGFGGQVDVTLIPREGSGYLPLEASVDLRADNQLFEMTLLLEKGVRLYGTVTSNNTALDSVNISVEGRKYITTLSKENGAYELYVPSGEQEIRVAKSGYMVQKENITFQKNTDVERNFSLEDGGGKNISQLLGFDIELEKAEAAADGAEIWTGSFVNITPYLSVFEPDGRLSLPFANIKVTFDGDGNAIPENNKVVTDRMALPLTLFGYLPLKFQNGGQQIAVIKNAKGWGSISGQLELDVDRILGEYNITFIKDHLPKIITKDQSTPGSVEIFLGEGATGMPGLGAENMENIEGAVTNAAQGVVNGVSIPDGVDDAVNTAQSYVVDLDNLEFRLAAEGTQPVKIELYGFTVILDLAKTTVSPDGLKLAGEIKTPQFGPVKSLDLTLKTLKLNRTFAITEIDIPTDELPELEIGGWKGALSSLLINESGLKLGGEISVKLPYSDLSSLEFSNLRITKDGVYGGEFEVTQNGIDLFDAALIKGNGADLSFGQIGNSGVYSLSGAVDMLFKKLISKEIEIPRFQIQTDGNFSVQAPVNFSSDFGFASFNINDLVVSNATGQMPYIELLGELNTEIPFLDFSASNIKFQATESGSAELIIGKIAANLDIPVINCGLELDLRDNGFAGGGNLEIPGTSISADINFHYFKEANGIDMGATFVAGVPIPLGAVTIAKVGGGFDYNTGNNKFKVTITGEASITGLSQAVKLAPINLSVESGPIIKGNTEVIIGDKFALAKSTLELNFPSKLFVVTVDAKMKPMEGLGEAQLNGLMRVSWNKNNTYAFLGVNTQIKVAGLLNANGQFAIGANVKNPKHGDNDISQYFRNMDDGLVSTNYVFSGLYAYGGLDIGPPRPKIGGSFWIASFSADYYAHADICLLFNFAQGDYLLSFNGSLSASAKACIDLSVWEGCMSAGFDACFSLAGGRTHQKGWFFKGNVGAELTFKVGSLNPKCNDWTTSSGFWYLNFGAKGCVSAHASIDYGQSSGLKLDGGLGGSNSGNLCR